MLSRFPENSCAVRQASPFDQVVQVVHHDKGAGAINLLLDISKIVSKSSPSSAHSRAD